MNINIMSIVRNLSCILIPIVTIYLFKRIIECFKGKTEAKVKNDVNNSSLTQASQSDLNGRGVSVGETTESKTLSGKERLAKLNDGYQAIMLDKSDPQQMKESLVGFAALLSNDDSDVRWHAVASLNQVIICEKKPMDAETANALAKTLIVFLNSADPIDGSLFAEDNKREIQLTVLKLIPNLVGSEGMEDKVLNNLAVCLLEKAEKSAKNFETTSISRALSAIVQKRKLCDSAIIKATIDYFISIVKKEPDIARIACQILYLSASDEQKEELNQAFKEQMKETARREKEREQELNGIDLDLAALSVSLNG